MSNISITEARGLFTKALIAKFNDAVKPTAFLQSFFKRVEKSTLNLSIEVMRNSELVAVDVERGSRGNANKFTKSTEKMFKPPYYREYFSATDLDYYDRLFIRGEGLDLDPIQFSEWVGEMTDKLAMCRQKIERAYELQCSQVFDTGIVTLTSGDNIDFKRKPASMVDLTGAYWDGASVDPIDSIVAGAKFIRTEGKSGGGVLNMICGGLALNALLNNAKFQSRSDIKDFDLAMIEEPQSKSDGMFHGRLSAGSWKINVWTYPEFYENPLGTSIPYVGEKKAILLPTSTNFVLGFAGVPTLIQTKSEIFPRTVGASRGQFIVGDYVDDRQASHEIDVKSAGVAIPVAVDQIYTMQVLA